MKLIYSLILVAVLSACTTTTAPDGTKTTSVDPKGVKVITSAGLQAVSAGTQTVITIEQIKADKAAAKEAKK